MMIDDEKRKDKFLMFLSVQSLFSLDTGYQDNFVADMLLRLTIKCSKDVDNS